MPDQTRDADAINVLSTKVEEDFISPLTAIRGALEIMRDYPDLDDEQRANFIAAALRECQRMEHGVDDLARAVYTAADRPETHVPSAPEGASEFAARISFLDDRGIAQLDFSDFVFDSSATVNAFFDAIEAAVQPTGRRWYFLVDYSGCSVFPEAWVAFAHRGKEVRVMHGFGTIRYSNEDDGLPSRDQAMAEIAEAQRLSGNLP